MKYISFIDQLGIDIHQLKHIDAQGIIKLQKQLKAKAMLGDANNLGDLASLIEKLKDASTRDCHVFVENHVWLKQLLSGNFNDIQQNEISVNDALISDEENLKYFLAPFLREHIKLFLSETLNKGKYVLILKVLTHHHQLFSEEINQLVINFFKARLNYAAVYLREKRLKDKEYPIAYIKNKVFINCLNEYPDCFNLEMQELNSEVIEVYNSKRRNVSNPEFVFAAKAMVAFAILDTSSVFLEQTLKSNADIAREYTYPSRRSQRTGSGFGGWSIFVIIMIVLRIIFWASQSSSSSNYDYINTGDFNIGTNDRFQRQIDSIERVYNIENGVDIEETVIESTERTYDDRYKLENHLKFIYTLKLKVNRNKIDDNGDLTLYPFSNPYPMTFNEIYNEVDSQDNTLVKINNKSSKDLIVFRLTNGVDESIYIPKNEILSLDITNNDSLVFYTGLTFLSSKFSHFKTDDDLSEMYQITNVDTSVEKEITIYPFKETIRKVESSSSDKILTSRTREEQLDTKNVELIELNIDRLYTNYYNKKYRN
ncbi:hypothetical protein ACU8DI_09150 [Psychroserpens sp. BH13MA-6]